MRMLHRVSVLSYCLEVVSRVDEAPKPIPLRFDLGKFVDLSKRAGGEGVKLGERR